MSFTSPSHARSAPQIWLLTGILLLTPIAASAQQHQVTLDPAQSKIEWTLDATMHTVHGSFRLKSGTITFDPASGNAAGEIVVDATSAESGNSDRDKKMHKDVLESKRYPEITFLPKHVLGKVAEQGASSVQMQGVFHIHGADHEMTLSVPVQKQGDQVKATVTFVVPYQQWGMKNPSNFFLHVADKVDVSISAVGKLTPAEKH